MKLNFIGNLFGTSGYAIHLRKLANAVNEITKDVRIETDLPQGWETVVTDAEYNMITKPFNKEYITIAIHQPPFYPLSIAHNPKKFIGFCVWEGDKTPDYWLKYLSDERIDMIFVPSKHTLNAIIESTKSIAIANEQEVKWINSDYKIKIIPHGFDPNEFYPIPELKNKKRPFTFLCNKGWKGGLNDRGGVQFLIKAFLEEFKKEDVRLLLKLNPAYLPPDWNFDNELRKIGIKKENYDPVLFNKLMVNFEHLSTKQLNDVYNESDVYICTQMADAFNLGGIEAMGAGLPTIQSYFGGQTDYIDENKTGWLITEGEMVDVKEDINYEGIKWFKPDISDIKRLMRRAYNKPLLIKKMGENAEKEAHMRWKWSDSAKKLIESLKSL